MQCKETDAVHTQLVLGCGSVDVFDHRVYSCPDPGCFEAGQKRLSVAFGSAPQTATMT